MWLTGRAVALLAAAAVSFVVAVTVGVPSLLYVAGLCVGLVACAIALTWVARPRVEAVRHVEPAIAEPDEPVEITIDLVVRSRVPLSVLAWRDRLPTTVLESASGSVPLLEDGRARVGHTVQARRRGSHQTGPLTLVVSDAFGLVGRTLTHPDRDRFVVLPRRSELDDPEAGGTTEGLARAHRRHGAGQDDVIARPYRPGDALKRWHWKATAHHGEPMVRQEESDSRPTVQVVLDLDPRVHDHGGFEWSVSAAASILAHHSERGFDVHLVCGGSALSLESGQGLQEALVALALVEPVAEPPVVPRLERATFVLSGQLDGTAAAALTEAVPARDVVAFVARGTSESAFEALSAAGWHVVVRDDTSDLEAAWQAARPGVRA